MKGQGHQGSSESTGLLSVFYGLLISDSTPMLTKIAVYTMKVCFH